MIVKVRLSKKIKCRKILIKNSQTSQSIFLTSQVDHNIWCCWYSSKFASICLQRHHRVKKARNVCERSIKRETYRSLLVTWWKTCVEKYLMCIIIIIKNNIIYPHHHPSAHNENFTIFRIPLRTTRNDIKMSLNKFLFDTLEIKFYNK